MKIRVLLGGALVAATAASFAPSASAMTCPPPAVSTVCWAWGVACRYVVPHGDGHLDPHALACTVVA